MQSKLIPFNATDRERGGKKGEHGEKSRLDDEKNRDERLFVAESTRRKEATKKGRKEGRMGRGQGNIVRESCYGLVEREKCQKLREYLVSTKEEERRRKRRPATRRENRGPRAPWIRTQRGDETNRENETKSCREMQ